MWVMWVKPPLKTNSKSQLGVQVIWVMQEARAGLGLMLPQCFSAGPQEDWSHGPATPGTAGEPDMEVGGWSARGGGVGSKPDQIVSALWIKSQIFSLLVARRLWLKFGMLTICYPMGIQFMWLQHRENVSPRQGKRTDLLQKVPSEGWRRTRFALGWYTLRGRRGSWVSGGHVTSRCPGVKFPVNPNQTLCVSVSNLNLTHVGVEIKSQLYLTVNSLRLPFIYGF